MQERIAANKTIFFIVFVFVGLLISLFVRLMIQRCDCPGILAKNQTLLTRFLQVVNGLPINNKAINIH